MQTIIDLCTPTDDLKVIIEVRKGMGFTLVHPREDDLKPTYKGALAEPLIIKDWIKPEDAAGNKIDGSPVDKRVVLVFEKA